MRPTRLALGCVLGCALVARVHAQNVQIPIKSYGQELVDRALARNPGLLVVVIRGRIPGTNEELIIASNIGRIGEPGNQDDRRVIAIGRTNPLSRTGSKHVEVVLALHDVEGGNVGALGLVFPYIEGESEQAVEQKATTIRDALGRYILNAANLFDPYPFAARATTKAHAQKLVDQTLATHPELTVLAMHVAPPGAENIIIGSNFGRHGKKADGDDLRVITTGQPTVDDHNRFRVALPLLDTAGDVVGELNAGFRAREGEDRQAVIARAEKIRDELRLQIPSVESLVELDP